MLNRRLREAPGSVKLQECRMTTRARPLINLCLCLLSCALAGQLLAMDEPAVSNRVTVQSPISTLPPSVVAPSGELTLYADFDKAGNGSITLYLINRTPHHLAFMTQDGDPFIKLEGDIGGRWERAQPHFSSGCGNSYIPTPILRPDHYFPVTGRYPSDGRETQVRYRLCQEFAYIVKDESAFRQDFLGGVGEQLPLNVVSNTGSGRIVLEDVTASQKDMLAIRFGSYETIFGLAQEEMPGGTGRNNASAIEALGRFSTDESLALLVKFSRDAHQQTSCAAVRGLVRMTPSRNDAAQALLKVLLGHDQPGISCALRAMRECHYSAEVVGVAKQLLTNADLRLRVDAMGILAQHCKNRPHIKEYVNSIYDDPDPRIQEIFETILCPTCIDYDVRGYKGRFNESRR